MNELIDHKNSDEKIVEESKNNNCISLYDLKNIVNCEYVKSNCTK